MMSDQAQAISPHTDFQTGDKIWMEVTFGQYTGFTNAAGERLVSLHVFQPNTENVGVNIVETTLSRTGGRK